jgi:hypothetical protein
MTDSGTEPTREPTYPPGWGVVSPDELIVCVGKMHRWYLVIWAILIAVCAVGLVYVGLDYRNFRAGAVSAVLKSESVYAAAMFVLLIPVYFGVKYHLDCRLS